jgi:hypothetical protein
MLAWRLADILSHRVRRGTSHKSRDSIVRQMQLMTAKKGLLKKRELGKYVDMSSLHSPSVTPRKDIDVCYLGSLM